MIARFFINKDKLSYIFIFVAAISLFVLSLFIPAFYKPVLFKTSFFFRELIHFSGQASILIFHFIFLLGNAFLVSQLCVKHELTDKQNQLPALIYLLISNVHHASGALHPILPATTFILLSLNNLFLIYRQDNSNTTIFDACFLLSISSLFYSPFLIFILLPFIALLIMKSFKFNEWFAAFLGVITPFFILSMMLYILNRPFLLFLDVFKGSFQFVHPFLFTEKNILIHVFLFLLISLSITFIYKRINQFKVKSQKSIHVFLWMIAFGILGVFMVNEDYFFFCTLFILPISIYIGHYLGAMKRKRFREFLTLILLIAVVCSNLQSAGFL